MTDLPLTQMMRDACNVQAALARGVEHWVGPAREQIGDLCCHIKALIADIAKLTPYQTQCLEYHRLWEQERNRAQALDQIIHLKPATDPMEPEDPEDEGIIRCWRIKVRIAQHQANLELWQTGVLTPTEPDAEERQCVIRELKAVIAELELLVRECW